MDLAAPQALPHGGGSAQVNVLVIAVLAVIGFAVYVGFGTGFDNRRYVSEAMVEAVPLKDSVLAFRRNQGRWPGPADAATFKVDKSRLKRARSIVYDPVKRAVVITMDEHVYAGKSFEFFGDEREGAPVWGCRRNDLDAKYLPASCR